MIFIDTSQAVKEVDKFIDRNQKDLNTIQGKVFMNAADEFGRQVSKYGSRVSPYLTGTLSRSHSHKSSSMDGGAKSRVFLEDLRNPVYGGIASEYGVVVHDVGAWGTPPAKPWWEVSMVPHAEDTVLPQIEKGLLKKVLAVMND